MDRITKRREYWIHKAAHCGEEEIAKNPKNIEEFLLLYQDLRDYMLGRMRELDARLVSIEYNLRHSNMFRIDDSSISDSPTKDKH
tara:strand:- start:120 stop:374 length:255 start_codon:yes stop_codon:yes gene_type:complete